MVKFKNIFVQSQVMRFSSIDVLFRPTTSKIRRLQKKVTEKKLFDFYPSYFAATFLLNSCVCILLHYLFTAESINISSYTTKQLNSFLKT